MKKYLPLLCLALITGIIPLKAQRYLDEIFTTVNVTKNVMYSENISVLTGAPAVDTLYLDIYTPPTTDGESERPLVLYAHTGSFLPNAPQSQPINLATTGSKEDSAVVEICMQLARRGYVAAAFTYRSGWNPLGVTQDERTGTLLNAAYRGIQDARAAVRWFRKNHAENGNQYGIDPEAIISFGQGSGGYITFGMASLDKYEEVTLPKFIDAGGNPYLDTTLSGDAYGFGGSVLNIENHSGYSSDIAMGVNLGGAIGDSTWLEPGDAPVVSFHVPNDPFAPYDYGAVIVPTNLNFVVNVSGSKNFQEITSSMGNNDCFSVPAASWTDPYTTAANAVNGGLDGLYPLLRPSPESAPWEWWNPADWQMAHPSGGTYHDVSSMTNPDMSKEKAMMYIDTIMGYSCARIVECLALDTSTATGRYDEQLGASMTVFPNPASQSFEIRLENTDTNIDKIEILTLQGKVVRTDNQIRSNHYAVSREGLASGLYLVRVSTSKGSSTSKIMFD